MCHLYRYRVSPFDIRYSTFIIHIHLPCFCLNQDLQDERMRRICLPGIVILFIIIISILFAGLVGRVALQQGLRRA
jgi:hypothetical protein